MAIEPATFNWITVSTLSTTNLPKNITEEDLCCTRVVATKCRRRDAETKLKFLPFTAHLDMSRSAGDIFHNPQNHGRVFREIPFDSMLHVLTRLIIKVQVQFWLEKKKAKMSTSCQPEAAVAFNSGRIFQKASDTVPGWSTGEVFRCLGVFPSPLELRKNEKNW